MVDWKRETADQDATDKIASQHRRSMFLMVTSIIRTCLWVVLGILIAAGLAGASDFGWAKDLSHSLAFLALVSIYANAATDLDAAIAAFAALVASRGLAVADATRRAVVKDFETLSTDISRLASLDPGPEAAQLAEDIRYRLYGAKKR